VQGRVRLACPPALSLCVWLTSVMVRPNARCSFWNCAKMTVLVRWHLSPRRHSPKSSSQVDIWGCQFGTLSFSADGGGAGAGGAGA